MPLQTGKKLRKTLDQIGEASRGTRVNLFDVFPRFRSFFANRVNILYTRVFGDIFFTVLILLGLFGPQDPNRNIALFICWGVWWTSVVLSWFFLGKLWCGICPFPGIGRLLQKIGLGLHLDVPQSLRKFFVHFSVVLLGLIIWVESVTSMKEWPAGTAYLLLSILMGATITATSFKGQAWCRHICPLGKIIGSAATIAMTEFRPDRSKCKDCRTVDCRKGSDGMPGCPIDLGALNVKSNFYCLVCGHCVPLCKKGSPAIYLRSPFVEITSQVKLTAKKTTYLTYSYIIPFFMGSQLARFVQHHEYYKSFEAFFFGSNLAAFTALLVLGNVFFLCVIRIGALFFKPIKNDFFGLFSPMVPVIVPMAFTGELAYRLDYFMSNVGNSLPVLGRQFGINLEWLAFNIPGAVIYGICMIVLAVGLTAGCYVLHIFHRGGITGSISRKKYMAVYILIFLIFIAYIVLFASSHFHPEEDL